jgi:hypothetical protein
MPGSPALGAGNDGADLGANPMPDYSGQPQVMFSEILYHDTLTTTDEFLELHNPGSQPVELGGYTLFGALDYVFPTGASIAPGEYLVVARDAAKFPANAPYQVFQWASGKLADEGEKILLYDATGLLVDFVRYNNHAPWPEVNTMFGKSLELASVDLDNHFASSWQPSGPWGGTPGGQSNSVGTNSPNTLGTELAIFPNPAGSSVRISVKNAESGTVFLQITDLNGRVVYSEKLSHPGGLLIKPLDVSGFTSGMYVVRALDAEYNLLGLERLVIERR